MCKVIAIASQKGETAKSTTCRNLTDCFEIESSDKLYKPISSNGENYYGLRFTRKRGLYHY
ncbi:hypothetical protein [Maledivibacter halophilus]|uniref:ParA family protein n=1 Tax=Maledivibacter halophilus TaxID=36842 RepID=A0A1T5MK98_9FIRM|nr:hypothetical protein [Maledivibacter halophilus]SKC88483.1 hypothetical protein SAMN02194393_04887 [Maledivibacter halophilus]